MEEATVKTSLKQRIIIGAIALFLLGSTLAVYIFITLGNDNINYSRMTAAELEKAYSSTYETYTSRVSALSEENYPTFSEQKSRIKAYNKDSANADGIKSEDIREGDGEELGEKYSAYYIGWCADETIFDSSFTTSDAEDAAAGSLDSLGTSLKAPIPVTPGSLIEGWYLGTAGMKLGGIREITIPGPLAYGDTTEICGGKNSPLKFLIYALPYQTELHATEDRLSKIYSALSAAYAQDYSNYSELDYSDSTEE